MKRRTEAGLSMVDADAGDRTEKLGARSEGSGRQPQVQDLGASNTTARPLPSQPEAEMRLMATIVSRENMMTAYQRVVANKGAPGIDRMTVEQLKPYLVEHWPRSTPLIDLMSPPRHKGLRFLRHGKAAAKT
jgi:RNA-directed DNA polymerase